MPSPADKMTAVLKTFNFPRLPQVTQTLIAVMNDPKSTASDIAAVIQTDPMLTARLLKVANSSYFGQQRAVTSLERATVVLGLNYIKSIGLASQLSKTFAQLRAKTLDMDAFWRNSLLRACIARQLALRAGVPQSDQAFIIGLTQDIAIPALASHHGIAYADTYNRLSAAQHEFCKWERETFDYDHAQIAEALLDSWNLPVSLTCPIGRHHTLAQPAAGGPGDSPDISRLSILAGFVGALPLTTAAAATDDAWSKRVWEATEQHLKLNSQTVGDALQFAQNEFETIRSLFEELLPDDINVTELLNQAMDALAAIDPAFAEIVLS